VADGGFSPDTVTARREVPLRTINNLSVILIELGISKRAHLEFLSKYTIPYFFHLLI